MVQLSERIVHCIKNPLRIIDFITERSFGWQDLGSGFKRKNYRTYDEYVSHQRSKLDKIGGGRWITNYSEQFSKILGERLEGVKPGSTVLCLGARTGAEVRPFLLRGCFAVGIDLNPGEGNKYVLQGDFHDIQFPDGSVDVVYTNSIDHVFDSEKFISEIRRVLRPRGTLILELMETKHPEHYESFDWHDVGSLIKKFEEHRFETLRKTPFRYPWEGSQFVMRLVGGRKGSKKT